VGWHGVKSRKLVGEARRYSGLVFDDAERAEGSDARDVLVAVVP
jgi:hypothetical protein